MSTSTINNKVTFGETTFEFSYNEERTFNYDGKGTMKVETHDVLINGEKSIYDIRFNTETKHYMVYSNTPEKRGGVTIRQLNFKTIDGSESSTRFPINVVCDIVKLINQ